MVVHTNETSRVEINLNRLLSKCELMGLNSKDKYNWRLEKFTNAANGMLLHLMNTAQKPSREVINEYSRRIEFLRKLVASQKVESPVERVLAAQMMSHGVTTATDNLTKEIHQKTSSKYASDVRAELFKMDKDSDSSPRRRRGEKTTGEDHDAMLKQHKALQERVTEDLMSLTRTLKEQSQLANSIIKKDVETMTKSSKYTEENTVKLKLESAILAEHNRRAWKCWLWVLLVVVMVVFVNMVLFMRIMKK